MAELESAAHDRLVRELRHVLAGDDPIVVGPWRAEVGFEALYWIPFLRWLAGRYLVPPERLIAFSRGGAHGWYKGVCASYVDAFEVLDVDDYRLAAEDERRRAGGQKQPGVSALDRRLLHAAEHRIGRRYRTLHPSHMFELFRHTWKGGGSLAHVLDHVRYARWPTPHDAELEAALPDDFVAVKLYFRDSFPDTARNRAFVASLLERLSAQTTVVLLNTGLAVDEHREADAASPHVLRPLEGVESVQNLHAQSVVLNRARSFVGTYGGLSYVASAYGVPGISVASDPSQFFPSHLDVARRAAAATDAAFTLLDTTTLPELVLPGAGSRAAVLLA